MSDVTITGTLDIEAVLKELPRKVGNKVIRQAVRRNLKPIRDAAQANAPVKSGQTRKAIKIRAMKRKKGRIGVKVQVGPGDYKGDTYYAAFNEYGTSRMPARPFMRPAFDAHADEARDGTIREILNGIESEARAARRN